MQNELIPGAATIAVELLRQMQSKNVALTQDVIAATFAQAYQGLEIGIQRVLDEELKAAGL